VLRNHSINSQPFRKLDNHDAQLQQYRLPVLKLLAMLLRGSPVPLTSEMSLAITSLQASLSVTSDVQAISKHILDVLSCLWQHSWAPLINQRISDPTILCLALTSLESSGNFKSAKEVSPVIAKKEYIMRLVFLLLINRHKDGHEAGYRQYEVFLKEGYESTFNSLRNAQRQASSIAYMTQSLPKVWWIDRKTYREMAYQGTRIHISQIHSLLAALEHRMQTVWEQDILLGLDDLHVAYDQIHDNLASTKVGYSFWTDPRNKCFSDKQILLKAVLQNKGLASRFILPNVNGVLRFNVHAGRAWLTKLAHFHLLLLLRFYLTGGAPARITELTAMLLWNTAFYPLRNLIAFGSFIALTCTYLKTSKLSGHDKVIPHALDAFSSDLLIQELAIARPFAVMLAAACYPSDPKVRSLYSKHVFVNHTELFRTDHLTRILQKFSIEFLNIELGVSDWRHISAAFRRKLCGRLEEIADEQEEGESIDALQMGHSRQTDIRVYGISQEALHGAAEDVLPLFLDASTDWQIVCKVVPGGIGYLPYKNAQMSSFDALVQSGRICGLTRTSDGTITEQMVLTMMMNRIGALEAKISVLDTKIDQLLEQRSEKSPSPLLADTDALQMLRRLLKNPVAQWKTVGQREAVMAALQRQHDVVAILPTNAGKSMVALIPSMLEPDMVTVIVLPLRMLILDFQRKLQMMGLSFCTYQSDQPHIDLGSANIVLVSADHAMWGSWRQAILVLHQHRSIARIVIDEAHIPLLSQDFRHTLSHMSDIRMSLPVQIVLLTASAHPALLTAMCSEYCLEPGVIIVRSPPNRPELRYVWRGVKDESSMLEPLKEAIRDNVVNDVDRAIIFVPWKSLGGDIARELGCRFYHGEDDSEKCASMYHSWLAGNPPVIVATSAFGTGNDYAHVRLVVHACAPYEMTHYVQEVSRAGRDGASALCLLMFVSGKKPRKMVEPEEEDLGGKNVMAEAVRRPFEDCIRHRVTSYADPQQGAHCSSDSRNETCGRCVAAHKQRSAGLMFLLLSLANVMPKKPHSRSSYPLFGSDGDRQASQDRSCSRAV
jgi:superfamily II DNA helicase RecQ